MSETSPPCPALLDAVAFASQAHQHEKRKDGKTPYSSHVFRVCLVVRHVFGISDDDVLAAALLHDTIEDTPKDYDDIAERFGTTIADYVAALTKDMRKPDDVREAEYRNKLARSPWQVKVCKLADVYDNLIDSAHLSDGQRQRTLKRSRSYLDALHSPALPQPVTDAWNRTNELLSKMGG
jgi:(p)ppGpp synthase/HD superfamily hydrolase